MKVGSLWEAVLFYLLGCWNISLNESSKNKRCHHFCLDNNNDLYLPLLAKQLCIAVSTPSTIVEYKPQTLHTPELSGRF